MLHKTIASLVLLFVSQLTFAQKQSDYKREFGLGYFLKSLYDISSLPEYTTGIYDAEVSTYDRTGMNNDGFNGTYSFVRRNADSTLVIFDQKGPGVINRFWTPTPTNDTMDFYIDDTSVPTFSICYMDLFSGKVFPFIAPLCANQLGGYYCYLPIPFNKFCKIVLRAKTTRFHQIGYRLFNPKLLMKSFSMEVDKNEKASLQQIKSVWNSPVVTVKDIYKSEIPISEIKKIFTLQPGQTVTIFQAATGGRIAGFELNTAAAMDTIAKNIDIKISWDNEKTPAVYCPLADYFGYAFGNASMQGLLVGSDGKRHYSMFPMPYDKAAKIELIYRKATSGSELNNVTLLTTFYVSGKKRDVANEGKFYAMWYRENPVPNGQPFTMLDVKGRGHLAGVALQSQGLVPGITGFFEGDDSTVVDGELRYHGTGSEDFFNGGWYALLDRWDDATSLPLSGALDYSIPLARTGGYRFFINDKISFAKSLQHSIEHGPEGNQWPADYTSVSYYYCDRTNPQFILPNNSNTKIYMPDTLEIYPQLMYTAMDENMAAETKWDGTPAKTMYYTVSNETLLKMLLYKIPPGNFDVYVDYHKGINAAQFSLWQRQTQISPWIDANGPTDEKLLMQKAGSIIVTDNNRSISFRFKTSADKNKFVLSRIVLVKKK
ncbi:DUF2961 domain-containing protein [Ferruginibacter paludis]|uniref:glycoside hydrolase family 172 protein n=1 Tax=Ferruginibacter paludis TaxID=1310417 RepID=UPI0025B29797|nr:glycoside hydrolase family 172 protein [Ferruginibacter paludis]MDN3656796.1 DUF2961 domain-containing protein [Ferruginibacter paludis]